MKILNFCSHVQLDISLICCAYLWDIRLNNERNFHVSMRPCIIFSTHWVQPKAYWGIQLHPDLSTSFIGSIQLWLITNIIFVIFSHIILLCITLISRLFLCLNYSSNRMLKLDIIWQYVRLLNKVSFFYCWGWIVFKAWL